MLKPKTTITSKGFHYIFNVFIISDTRLNLLKDVHFVRNTCPQCFKVFKRKDHVQRHYLELHIFKQNKMGYPCTFCDKLFKRKYILDHHMKTCKGVHQCNICLAPYEKSRSLMAHMRICHNIINE